MQTVKLTPKSVALAIGVSESSMKRWCDRGLIEFETTTGGHRRLSQASVISFLRNGKHALVKSELIGLPAGIRPREQDAESARSDFQTAILDGHEDEARKVLMELFIGAVTIAELGDQIIAPTFKEIGVHWECKELLVYRERRACEISLRLLAELRPLLPTPKEHAPLAIGGSPGASGYSLPTMLIEMVFRENGWRAESLGVMLSFDTLQAAARDQNPRLFWLSVSVVEQAQEQDFLKSFDQFRSSLPTSTLLAVGGSALEKRVRDQMQFSAFGDNLTQLETHARNLKTSNFPAQSNGDVSNY